MSLCSLLLHIDLQELPSLFYQLLLLATKGTADHKSMLLRTIALHLENISRVLQQKEQTYSFFPPTTLIIFFTPIREKENEQVQREQIALRHVEGTTLIHLSFAIKQDQVIPHFPLMRKETNIYFFSYPI